MDISHITGLILAGGRGTRMGTVDKGLQPFQGMPMVQHVMTRLAPQVGAIMINANQNIATYQALGVPVWQDDLQGFAGPLAGLQSGLMHCKTDYLVTSPCDSPFLPHDLVQRLAAALEENGADLAVAVTGDGQTRQPHHVFCLVRTSTLPHLTHYLQNGGRKFATWYSSLHAVEVHFDDEDAFRNINTLDDLHKYETR